MQNLYLEKKNSDKKLLFFKKFLKFIELPLYIY